MGARQSTGGGGVPAAPAAGRSPKSTYSTVTAPVGYVITSDPVGGGAPSSGRESTRWPAAVVAGPSSPPPSSAIVVGYPGPVVISRAAATDRPSVVGNNLPVVSHRRPAPPPPTTVPQGTAPVSPPTLRPLLTSSTVPTRVLLQRHPTTTTQPVRGGVAHLFPAMTRDVGERTVAIGGGGVTSVGSAWGAPPSNFAPASASDVRDGGGGLLEAIQALSLSSQFALFTEFRCSVCRKTIPSDNIETHLLTCLMKPQLIYNEDILLADKGECSICFDDLQTGNTIARLPCLCVYHKSCIDDWFTVSRCCPEHPDS